MLKSELHKTWSRPLVVLAFLLACLAQIIYAASNYHADNRAVADACNRLGGVMDEGWRTSVYEQFDRLWTTPPQATEDILNATAEQRAVLTAYDYTFFTETLDSYMEGLRAYYGADPDFDLNLIDRAYAKLRTASENSALVFGISSFGSSMSSQYMVTWGFLIFMIILCVDQFSGERSIGMVPLQHVTKRGRRRLFWTKLQVCQLSALLMWLAANAVYGITLLCCYGWGSLGSVVQDFTFNACPYDWNTGEFMAVVLSVSLVVSQLVAVVIFLLARVGGSTQRTFALMGGILILPYLIAFQTDLLAVALWLPCLMHGSWLWSGLIYWKIFGMYVQPRTLAAAEMLIIAAVSLLALRHFAHKAESTDDI